MAMDKEALDAFVATIGTMPTEKQLKLFLKIREASAAATRVYEEEKAQFKAIMDACQNHMLATADSQGTTGFKTELGTTYTAETVKITVADSTAFTAFLDGLPPDADRYGFFETRISSRRIEDYMKANGGTPPPGLNLFRERVMRVRKASEK
jgi:hypothetical protein